MRYKYPKKCYYKSKKSTGKCECCGKELPDKLLFSYVDESNAAITRNAPYLCWRCYNEKYPNDQISIITVLRQSGYNVDFFPEEKVLYINDKKCEINADEIIKEYNL